MQTKSVRISGVLALIVVAGCDATGANEPAIAAVANTGQSITISAAAPKNSRKRGPTTLTVQIDAAPAEPGAGRPAVVVTAGERGDVLIRVIPGAEKENGAGSGAPSRATPAPATPPNQQPSARNASKKASVDLTGAEILGSPGAPITMVEFSDYQCPFCQRFHSSTFEEIRKKYIDSGKVRFVALDYPLQFHQNASKASEAAHCAADQNLFWEMRDKLSANPGSLADTDLVGYAHALGMNVTAFQSCLDSGKYQKLVAENRAKGDSAGVAGTPAFVIGLTTPGGVNGIVIAGALPLQSFESQFAQFGVK